MSNKSIINNSSQIKPLEDLTLMDDYMFSVVMREKENLEPLLECILGFKIRQIRYVEPQKTEKVGYGSRGIRMDLYVEDMEGHIFNVEVQTTDKKYLPKRMRYYQSVLDISVLAPGVDYRRLKESFVIFICKYDPFNKEESVYTFENRCREDPSMTFGDQTLKVVVNTKGRRDHISTEFQEFLDYLENGTVSGDYTRQLDVAVKHVKRSEERRLEYMIMRIREMEMREEGRIEGRIEGIYGAVALLRDLGMEEDKIVIKIMQKYQLPREEAEELVYAKTTA